MCFFGKVILDPFTFPHFVERQLSPNVNDVMLLLLSPFEMVFLFLLGLVVSEILGIFHGIGNDRDHISYLTAAPNVTIQRRERE